MYLGIEIGGTKLQLAVGAADGEAPVALVRKDVAPQRGAGGILEQIERETSALLQKWEVSAIGIGFGGPCDAKTGVVHKSHQIGGWDSFHLADWIEQMFQKPCRIANDCDAAAMAEAKFGAGRNADSVFYVTVGTGVGGGFVVDNKLFGATRPAVAEIGHLRPGLHEVHPESTVESLASGWGIVAHIQQRLAGDVAKPIDRPAQINSPTRVEIGEHLRCFEKMSEEYAADLLARCQHDADQLTAKIVAQAAADGNAAAADIIARGVEALGWAIAQTITLLAPEIVVVGGGVALMGDHLFMTPLREQTARFVFPPLADSYQIVASELSEEVVLHGALLLAEGSEGSISSGCGGRSSAD